MVHSDYKQACHVMIQYTHELIRHLDIRGFNLTLGMGIPLQSIREVAHWTNFLDSFFLIFQQHIVVLNALLSHF